MSNRPRHYATDGAPVPPDSQECTRCLQVKPITEFYRDGDPSSKLLKRCLPCRVTRRKNKDGTLAPTGPRPAPKEPAHPAYTQMYNPHLLRKPLV